MQTSETERSEDNSLNNMESVLVTYKSLQEIQAPEDRN